jgi:ribosomal protein L22
MTDEPEKKVDPESEPESADASSSSPADAEAQAEQAEVESEAVEPVAAAEAAEAEAESPVAEPEAAIDNDDDALPPTDDEPVPLEEDDEPPVAEPDGDIGEEEAEEADAGETRPARPRRMGSSRSRVRAERDPTLPAPVVRAHAKYVRSSARKARLVCDQFRGRSVEEARAILAVTPRAIARDWSKLLESAVANAEHNHELVGEDLYVKAAHADEGPTIKRYQPRAKGRATRIRKRTSHLTILLTPKD